WSSPRSASATRSASRCGTT
ncbi:MAG: hypothetical protein AVDCRST_MAG24-1874, partial [uncultured Nocardioidaceae bacterium]